ncbi:hypothetical protein Tco_0653454 [Tanacetum coccineum]|uniref:Uncharacterized protein n=1 Tax=Tanacetum coccineum TaxID=301880 RepID=A0ABQ4X0X4_9ASTR
MQTNRQAISNTNHLSSSFQLAIRPSFLYDMRQNSSSSSSSLQASVRPNVHHKSSSSSSSSRSQSLQSQPTVHKLALHQSSSSNSLLNHDQDLGGLLSRFIQQVVSELGSKFLKLGSSCLKVSDVRSLKKNKEGKSQSEHIDEFHKVVGDLAAINSVISDEDQALLLLTSLLSSYDNFMDTLLYGRDTLKLEDRDMERGTYSVWSKSQGRSNRLRFLVLADGYDNADVMMAMSVEELLDWIIDSGNSYYITYQRD